MPLKIQVYDYSHLELGANFVAAIKDKQTGRTSFGTGNTEAEAIEDANKNRNRTANANSSSHSDQSDPD